MEKLCEWLLLPYSSITEEQVESVESFDIDEIMKRAKELEYEPEELKSILYTKIMTDSFKRLEKDVKDVDLLLRAKDDRYAFYDDLALLYYEINKENLGLSFDEFVESLDYGVMDEFFKEQNLDVYNPTIVSINVYKKIKEC